MQFILPQIEGILKGMGPIHVFLMLKIKKELY